MKTIRGFFLLFFCVQVLAAQTPRQQSAASIRMLKNGALLVRLRTSENYINVLMRRGDKAGAEKVRQEQEEKNRAIVNAFRDNFTFCPVYFFYSNVSDEIRAGKQKGNLLNVNFQTDTTFSGSNYLVGEFGATAITKIEGFLIEDKDYEQMDEPFPYLTRKNRGGFRERSVPEMARDASRNLQSYYEYIIAKK